MNLTGCFSISNISMQIVWAPRALMITEPPTKKPLGDRGHRLGGAVGGTFAPSSLCRLSSSAEAATTYHAVNVVPVIARIEKKRDER